VVFPSPQLGTNVATVQFDDASSALDATAVTVAPRALGARTSRRSNAVAISLDKPRYKAGDRVRESATLTGAVGNALVTVEGARVADQRLVPVTDGRATAEVSLEGAAGSVRIGVAFVKDGAIYASDAAVAIDGPGYPRLTALTPDRNAYAPGATAHVAIADGGDPGASLLAIRISDGPPSGGATFDDAPAILAAGGTTTQNPASPDSSWHAYVAPVGSKAQDIFAGERAGSVTSRDTSLAVSTTRALVWRVEGVDGSSFDVALPAERGSYVLSILKISTDGDVGAASIALSVR
ncbi:MAG: hypothetical protein ACHREM_29770, partial [Polyangiales bacterium]